MSNTYSCQEYIPLHCYYEHQHHYNVNKNIKISPTAVITESLCMNQELTYRVFD